MRFPEFSGEWERESIGKIASISKGIGISKDQLSEEGAPCILYGELYTTYKSEIINEIKSKTDIDSSNLVKSNSNDVIIPCSGETAEEIATARCVPYDGILLGGDLNVIRLCEYDGAFMCYQLNGRRKYDLARVAQGVSVVHLFGEHLRKIETFNPSLNEQKKIAYFLSLIDSRITTQNKIIEDFKKLRGAIIDWHYRRTEKVAICISDLGSSFTVMNLSKEDLSEEGEKCIIYGELFTTYGAVIDEVKSRTNKTYEATRSRKGDLLFPASTTVDAISLISPSSINEDSVILGGDLFGIHVSKNYNSEYLSYFFNYIANLSLAKYAHGSTIIHLHYTDIKDVTIELPSKKEQDKLAEIVRHIEQEIKNGEKLTQGYSELKNYLLQQMFI